MASVLPTRPRWQQIDLLFQAALECPAAELESFLSIACSGDPELDREVRALLDSAPRAESIIGEDAASFAVPLLAALDPDALAGPLEAVGPGSQLGAYRLLEEVGRGGMGTVFRAERADAQFRKQVAIKLVKRGMDTDEVLRRFRHERQILATLERPNIARLLDGGVTPDGRPYLVMEYVEGQPITAYCDQHGLDVAERLAVFQTVCRAVQYAHQNLVVHRDIKPSNILVTPAGDVKLLDFGIAKLLGDRRTHGCRPVRPAGAEWYRGRGPCRKVTRRVGRWSCPPHVVILPLPRNRPDQRGPKSSARWSANSGTTTSPSSTSRSVSTLGGRSG